jgi:hypothetical protein
MRFLPVHPERNVEGDGESPLVFNMPPENARRVWVTINERTLADSLGPAPQAYRLAEGASRRRLGFEPNIMHAVEGWAFVQDNGPERVDVKRDLLARIFCQPTALLQRVHLAVIGRRLSRRNWKCLQTLTVRDEGCACQTVRK